MMFAEPQVLRPYNRAEAIPVAEAALIAGCSVRTMREWCARYDIGRRIAGQWAVSRVALAMVPGWQQRGAGGLPRWRP